MKGGDREQCWPFKGRLNNRGRPYIRVKGKSVALYRVVYELVFGEGTLEGKVARHKCDNPACCNPFHIEPGTHEDNMKDMRDRERHGLPHHTVKAIRKLRGNGRSLEEIAELYGLGVSTVSEICSRKKYREVADGE